MVVSDISEPGLIYHVRTGERRGMDEDFWNEGLTNGFCLRLQIDLMRLSERVRRPIFHRRSHQLGPGG